MQATYLTFRLLGPGLPRTLGGASPLVAAADLLTPFFFGPWPSAGGPMTDGAGVSPLPGVAGLESEPLSGMAAAPLGCGVETEGESLESFIVVSSLARSDAAGSRTARSLLGETLRVMILEAAETVLAEDLRRSFTGADLLDGAIVSTFSWLVLQPKQIEPLKTVVYGRL
jgi:hypothetical protein